MTTKKTPMFRLLMCAALAMALCFSAALPVFAAGSPIEGTESDPAEAAITKRLVMPYGTATPNATFTFTITKVSFDDDDSAPAKASMPDLGVTKTVNISSADDATEDAAAGTKTINKESSYLLAGANWPHAGVYVYTVTEEAAPVLDSFAEKMTYSSAEYTLTVYVDNKADGSGLYVRYIAAVVEVVDNPAHAKGDKVDPRPGDKKVTPGGYSQMIFTNTYLKNNGGTDPGDAVFTLSKMVSGLASDQTKPFLFNVKVTGPTVAATTNTYKAYLFENGSVVGTIPASVTDAGNVKSDGTRDYIEFTTGAAINVNLKHNQKLSFIDLPVGSKFEVTEAATPDYRPSCDLLFSKQPTALTLNADKHGEPLATNSRFIGENENKAAFTNAYKTVTPTGIIVDNLPYLVLIGAALAAFAGFAVFKARKRAKQRTFN